MVSHALTVVAESSLRLRVWRPQACDTVGAAEREWFRVVFIDAGMGTMRVEQRVLEVTAGDVCWIAPGQEYELSALHGAAVWMLAFTADAIEPAMATPVLFAGTPRHPWTLPFMLAVQRQRFQIVLPLAVRDRWRAGIARLDHELTAQPAGHVSAARALLMLLLLDAARLVPAEDIAATLATRPARGALVAAALRFIEDNYRRPIGLRDVAFAVARSPAHLTDRVRRETGRPIGVWLLERRIAEARRLLLNSDLSTEQVAAGSGFGDPRHFARQFRRLNGLAPQAWRKAQRSTGRESSKPKEVPRRSKLSPL